MVHQPRPGGPQHSVAHGVARNVVLWERVRDLLGCADEGSADEGSGPRQVVDLGGGTGGLAVRAAELGHHVTVIDPSPDALASMHRRADENNVADRVVGVQGDTSDLGDHVAPGSVDVMLCHGVLEVVDDPDQALDAIGVALRTDGVLSVVVAGRYAAVLGRALAGHLVAARTLLEAPTGDVQARPHSPRRYTRGEILDLLAAHGFTAESVHGLRVFADLVPGSVVDTEPGAQAALVELERAVAQIPELTAVAGQLMVVSRRVVSRRRS